MKTIYNRHTSIGKYHQNFNLERIFQKENVTKLQISCNLLIKPCGIDRQMICRLLNDKIIF